jgi:uracil-DNA glycosylase
VFPATLHDSWRPFLTEQSEQPYFHTLAQFLQEERREHLVFPAEEDVFQAFRLAALNDVKVVILGQDPYHDDGQAHGLSFSVRPGVRLPPSLRNIFKELHSDLGITPAGQGCLEAWARQGVLLLNTVLTVRAHEPLSHRKKGWEQFTTEVIQCVNQLPHAAFVLWGSAAQEKAVLLDDRHLIIQNAHPSPLSARRGFFGSQPFSRINAYLSQKGLREIDWRLE